MNEQISKQDLLDQFTQALAQRNANALENPVIEMQLAEVEKIKACIAEKLGQCGSCPIALLAFGLARTIGFEEPEAVILTRPLCSAVAKSGAKIESTKYLNGAPVGLILGTPRSKD